MGSPVRGLNRGSLRIPTCKHVRGHRTGKGAEAMRPEEQGDQQSGLSHSQELLLQGGNKISQVKCCHEVNYAEN